MMQARPRYLWIRGINGFAFSLVLTVSLVYQATVVGLNPLQLVLVGTVLEFSTFLFEIPTGVVADAYSRRRSVWIGYALIGLGFIVEGAFPYFETVLLSQVIWGIGFTFISGAREAWIADEIGDDQINNVFLRGAQMGQIGSIMGILGSVALAQIALNIPILTGGGVLILMALGLYFWMPEIGFKRTPKAERETWSHLFNTLEQGLSLIKLRKPLLLIIVITILGGAASEGFVRLWTPHLLDMGLPSLAGLDPVTWFGLIALVSLLFSIILTNVVIKKDCIDGNRLFLWLFVSQFIIGASIISFGLATNFVWARGMYCVLQSFRHLLIPMKQAWLNRWAEPRTRATMFSFAGQAHALGNIAGGLVIGWIGSTVTVSAALITSGLMFLLALPLYGFALFFKKD